ncbi:MAG: ABC transporter substrate-binding protein [Tumebacillaceae bacterium]
MTLSRKYIAVAVSSLFLTTATGCSSTSHAAADHTLHVWIMGTGSWQDFYTKLADRFNHLHPDTPVELDFIPWDQAHDKLVTAVSAGAGPDVSTVGGRWTAELAAMGALEPLDQYINADYKKDFVDSAWASTQWRGKTWGIPQAFTTSGLYYRTDWLREAGYNHPPKTWAEFKVLAKKETTRAHYGFGLVGDPSMETTMFWVPFLWQNGGDILNANHTKAVFNSPAGVEALQFYVDLYRTDQSAPSGSLSVKRNDSQTEFTNGVVGMTTTGPVFLHNIKQDKPDLPFQVAPYPVGKVAANLALTDHIVMLQSAKHKTAAWAWIDYVTNTENARAWNELIGFIPYRKSGLQSAASTHDANFNTLLAETTHSRAYPTLPEWPQIDDAIAQAVNIALTGKKSPKEALDDAAEKVNALLAQSQ